MSTATPDPSQHQADSSAIARLEARCRELEARAIAAEAERDRLAAIAPEASGWPAQLLDYAFEGLAVHDGARMIYANPAYARLFGYTDANEIPGRSVHGLDDPACRLPLPIPADSHADNAVEGVGLRADGTRFAYEALGRPFPAAGATARIASLRDVSALKLALEALARSERRLADAQQVARIGSWEWDMRTDGVTWSDETFRLFGFEPQSFAPTLDYLVDSMPESQRASFVEALHQAREHGQPIQYVMHSLLPDGSLRDWSTRSQVVYDAAGRPARLLGTVQDVTEREGTLRAQQESERRFRTLFDTAPIGIVIRDRNGAVIDVNPAMLAISGRDRESFSATPRSRLMHPDDVEREAELFAALCAGRRDRYRIEVRFVRPAGDPIKVNLTMTLARDAQGLPQYAVGLFEDISERDSAEAAIDRYVSELVAANHRLQMADRYKDEFLSVISHELRTPLNFITGFASILDDEVVGPLDAMQHDYLGKILTGANRMLNLVEDLLDIARIQAGKIALLCEPYPYDTLVGDTLATMAPLFDAKRLRVDADVAVAAPVAIDPDRITQVLTNLLSNASKFTPEAGAIRVSARVEGERLITRVQDTGPGISPEDQLRLFERFQQLDMSATRAVGGTGLGLAISKALVEAHGGSIGVESTPGAGATFWFALPLTALELPA